LLVSVLTDVNGDGNYKHRKGSQVLQPVIYYWNGTAWVVVLPTNEGAGQMIGEQLVEELHRCRRRYRQ
jgi:hypothetical protein